MRRSRLFGSMLALLLAAAPALAFVEPFDTGNEGGWTFGGPGGSQPPTGGNPRGYLDSGLLDTFAPQLRTSLVGSEFTGDFRAKGVTSLGIDLITFDALSTGGRPLALMLIHDPGTPGNPFDDTAAYMLGRNIPNVGEGWLSYDYAVPSQETTLPAGWLLLNLGDVGAPPNATWDDVITDVDRVQYFYGDPTFVFIFQQWMLGADNARISADCLVKVTVTGTVEFNQINGSPLGDVNPGDSATMTFLVDPAVFTDSGVFPTRGYDIDQDSFTFAFGGGAEIGLQDPFPGGQTPFFVLRDNDPAVDGFFVSTDVNGPIGVPLDQAGIFGQFLDNYSVTYDGTTLESLDILDALGTYDFTGLTVFNWTVDDGPFNAMGLVFEQMVIEKVEDDGEPVPASSTWGMVTLVAMVLAAGLLLRRRGTTHPI